MGIGKNGSSTLHPRQQRSLSPHLPPHLQHPQLSPQPTFSPTQLIMTTGPPPSDHHQAAPHVMVSRINARLFSSVANGADSKDTIFDTTSSSFAQEGSTTDQSWSLSTNESFGNAICVQSSTSSSVSSSPFYNGRWCEEERAMPLKKRRVVMVGYESSQSKEVKKKKEEEMDAVERRQEIGEEMEGYESCNRKNGKGWRCNKLRVKGHSLCKHHLESQNMRKMKQCLNASGNQIKKNKARSISSLLRDTVPLS